MRTRGMISSTMVVDLEVRKVAYMNPTKNENGGDNKWI